MSEQNLHIFSDIEALQADFPGFVIWGETIHGRCTYIAQSVDGGTDPWVITSGNLNRLRARLEEPRPPDA